MTVTSGALVSAASRVQEGQKRGWDGGADRLWKPWFPPPAWLGLDSLWNPGQTTERYSLLLYETSISIQAHLAWQVQRQSRHMINVKWMNTGMRECLTGRRRVEQDGGLENAWEITKNFSQVQGWHYYSQNLTVVLMTLPDGERSRAVTLFFHRCLVEGFHLILKTERALNLQISNQLFC